MREVNEAMYIPFNGGDCIYRNTRPAFVVDAKAVSRVRNTRVFQKGCVLINRHRAFRRCGLQRVHVDQAANHRQNVLAIGCYRQKRPETLAYTRHFVVSLRAGSSRFHVTLQIGQGRPASRFRAPQYQHTNNQKYLASAGVNVAKLT